MANLDGGDTNNTLTGTNSADSITGGGGNDSISGGDGNDTLRGAYGDSITQLTDNDTLDGGAGNDLIDGNSGNDSLLGDTGDDTMLGGAGNDIIYGGLGDDVMDGGPGQGASIPGGAPDDDFLFGGDGNDSITGNSGNDSIAGGAGNDTLRGDDGDPATQVAGNDTIHAGDGNDLIDGNGGNDSLAADAGNDTIIAGEGADTVSGGTGNDSINFADSDNLTDIFALLNGDGNDTITGFSGPVSDGMGGFTSEDRFDISGMTDLSGNPVKAFDVTVSDDGFGNAVLTFPDGTSTTLIGVAPSQVDSGFELAAMGIVCFAAGTRIATDRGEVAIETLCEGDLVQTLDHGLQPIRWIGTRTVQATGALAPVCIRKGALGNTRDLRVSPQHRMLISGWMAQLYFGEDEVLVPAKALLNDKTITRQHLPAVTYCHILFDNHEVIFAEGALSESFHPGKEGMDALGEDTRAEVLDIFPELADMNHPAMVLARPTIKTREARLLGRLI